MTGESGCAAAPRHRWQAGRYRVEYDRGRWGISDSMHGVCNYRTPWGAWRALRRWEKVLADREA